MNHRSEIEKIYGLVHDNQVDKSVMACLRIAQTLEDHLYIAVFLRELHPSGREGMNVFLDATANLNAETQEFLWKKANKLWLETHTLDPSLYKDEHGREKDVFTVGITEVDFEIDQWERAIADHIVPAEVGNHQLADIANAAMNRRAEIRLRLKALQTVKQRVRVRCHNYAIRIERQLQAQSKTRDFLAVVQTDVNNYFEARSEAVFQKLQSAAQLVDSNNPEDFSLLLTQVRRAIKAAADFFYPPSETATTCADGQKRVLDDDKYLNRLEEFIKSEFAKSSSRDLLESEFAYLATFARRLNSVASKGVHADVTPLEAKQGLLGLYMFLFNVTSRLVAK